MKQALSRMEHRKKYHDFLVEIRKNQDRRHLQNDLQRIEGMLFHRLRPGLREHALFEQQRTKLQAAIAETMLYSKLLQFRVHHLFFQFPLKHSSV